MANTRRQPTPPAPDNEAETPTAPEAPEGSGDTTTNDLLRQLLSERQQDRAELAALRQDFAKSRVTAAAARPATRLSDEELKAERLREIEESPFYCPGCGALYKRERECNGRPEAPHPSIEVVSTDELKGDDPSRHTEAPGISTDGRVTGVAA